MEEVDTEGWMNKIARCMYVPCLTTQGFPQIILWKW